jgi:hypothetical protein
MRTRYYSPFWLAGGVLTLPDWAARDFGDDPRLEQFDGISMAEWLRLPDVTRAAIVEAYAARRPKLSRMVV